MKRLTRSLLLVAGALLLLACAVAGCTFGRDLPASRLGGLPAVLGPGAVPAGEKTGMLRVTVAWPARKDAKYGLQLIPDSSTVVELAVEDFAGTDVATASATRAEGEATASVAVAVEPGNNLRVIAETYAGSTGPTARGSVAGITVAAGQDTNLSLLLFPLYVPAVSDLSTDSGMAGSEITISGSNLAQNWAATPSVFLSGSGASVSATVTAATGSSVTFTVPSGAVTGAVELKVDGVGAAAGTFNVPAQRVLTTVTTWVGKGPPAQSGEVYNQTGQDATLYMPVSLVMDGSGNLYTAPNAKGKVLKITPDAFVTQYNTGGPANISGSDAVRPVGPARTGPQAGNLFLADWGHYVIRKVAPDGTVTLFAGTLDSSGNTLGLPGTGKLTGPNAAAIDNTGTRMFVSDWFAGNVRIIDMDTGEIVGAVAGRTHESAMAFDRDNTLYMAMGNSIYRWPAASWQAASPAAPTLYAGPGNGTTGYQDGSLASAMFKNPCGMTFDAFGRLWIADAENHVIRMISDMTETSGTVSTPLGTGAASPYIGFVNVSPPTALADALFNVPIGIAIDSAGRVYIADRNNHAIRRAE